MAFHLSSPFANFFSSELIKASSPTKSKTQSCLVSSIINSNQNIIRRSANYKPPIWDFDFVQSLRSEYLEEKYTDRISKLKEEVKMLLKKPKTPLNQLELIDVLQRLGLSYHFQAEIRNTLINIYNQRGSDTKELITKDLHTTAVAFRLFRQHGFDISQDIFIEFQDEIGNFKTSLCKDYKGMLSFYEASFLLEEDDNILEVARVFSRSNLENFIQQNEDSYLSKLINHALELPLHWRMLRLESRWYIDTYQSKRDMNPLLLELSKLDFNNVQATHQVDLQYVSCWWKSTGLGEKLSFARNMIVENLLWSIGQIYEPQFGYYRRMATKIISLITVLDDIYDVYGTLEELQLFTDAIERWDVNAIEQLPYYMQICFLATYNSVNEIGYDILIEQGFHIIPQLKKVWVDLCQSYLLEAKWYHRGYTPTQEEYIKNARISISSHVVLVNTYFLTKDAITIHGLNFLKEYPKIIELSSVIIRLLNDLRTSSEELKRGDVQKSIQCYMKETRASEEKAREHIHYFVKETWKKLNKGRHMDLPFSEMFIDTTMNLVRTANCMYKYEVGYDIHDWETDNLVLSLLVKPIPI